MSIPVDTYFIVTPGSNPISKAYATLNGTDLFFYVNESGSLRVVNMNSSGGSASPGLISYTLALGTKWVDVISLSGAVHVYYADTGGNIFHIPYTLFGGMVSTPTALPITGVVTFSVIYTPQSIPPAYMLIMDDGLHHKLFVATDPVFQAQLTSQPTTTYNNTLNTSIYLTQPTIAMHPQDTNRITVTFQSTTVLTSQNNVGFYEVRVPGVQ